MDFSPKLFRPLKNYALICDWNIIIYWDSFLILLLIRRSLINFVEINKKSRKRMFPGFFISSYRMSFH